MLYHLTFTIAIYFQKPLFIGNTKHRVDFNAYNVDKSKNQNGYELPIKYLYS